MEKNGTIWPLMNKLLLFAVVTTGLMVVLSLTLGPGHIIALAFGLVPLLLCGAFFLMKKTLRLFLFLYAVIFVIMGITRYVTFPLPVGILVDILIGLCFFSFLLHSLSPNKQHKPVVPPIFFLTLIWLGYCILEIANPHSSIGNWATTVRGIAFYLVLFPLLVFFFCNKVQQMRVFLILWGALILFAGFKAFIQKTIGFDSAEWLWLNTSGARTHILYSGIRYFSFFTDAANFGCHMGLGVVVFSILGIYEKSVKLKYFYFAVVFVATYGMMISGTRAAMGVPFAGLACFICIIKQWRWVTAGLLLFVAAFVLFNFTSIGNSNASMRRMRTAFQFEKDASYNLRVENQKRMRQFMNNYPFGIGIGSAKHSDGNAVMSGMATDSSFVLVWVETGAVGAFIYVSILLVILGYGMYCVLFKLKDPLIRGITCALTSGYAGMLVAGYGNEVFHQFPTGPTLYICMAFIMLSPQFDKELMYERKS